MESWDELSVKLVSKYYLGVDTSNYRTSVCLLDADGKIVFQRRPLLSVPQGKLGLRQQEAVFQHLQVLPKLLEELGPLNNVQFGVTNAPRPLPDSYMPCFLVGQSFVRALAAGRGFLEISHQENHLWAGLHENQELISKPFIAMHLSGGTTEFLEVTWQGKCMMIKELGGSSDISAGQFLDRIGVLLGLPFPAGPYLEKLAKPTDLRLGVPVKGFNLSYSGPEAEAKRLILAGVSGEEIAYAAILAVAKSVGRVLRSLREATNIRDFLLVGGVMANNLIKERLLKELHHPQASRVYFASPEASGDNALGVATALYWRD